MSQRAAYTPLRRMVALLEVLTGAARALTDAELMDRVPAYGTGPNADRTLRHDKRALRERGLVVTNVVMASHSHERGTARSPILEKAPEWHLTADEHRAVQQVRETLRRRALEVGPTTAVERVRGSRVDEALRLVRLLEEHDSPVEVEVVAASLGVGPRQARRWLRELADGFEPVELSYGRDADDIDEHDIVAARLRRSADPEHPLLETGADLLGLFPYSPAEVDERLELIAGYGEPVDAMSREVLDSVTWKLTSWRDFLRAAAS